MRKFTVALSLLLMLGSAASTARSQSDSTVHVLVVDAHPDDETAYAATIYKITHDLHGTVDLAVVTNGEGGYKYSTLAEAYYGLELTNEKIGRKYLPLIRKQELMNAGKIIGIHDYFFLDQKDNRYTLDPHEVLDSIWDVQLIQRRLHDILITGKYDYIFCLLPVDSTHGHHKGATIMALDAVQALGPHVHHPVVLGGGLSRPGDSTATKFVMLHDYPITEINKRAPVFSFNRAVKFGYHNVLDYKTIVNWEIAEHKSQGTMQMGLNIGDLEQFYFFAINDPATIPSTEALFKKLAVLHFIPKTY